MKRFRNHVDHVAWVSRWENLEANLARFEKLTGACFERDNRPDLGYTVCADWSAGFEVIAPMQIRTEANEMFHQWLETRGEGVIFVAFGVADLDGAAARLEAEGEEVGPLFEDPPTTPWHDRLRLKERIAGTVMNSSIVLGDIAYDDGMIAFEDMPEPSHS